MGPYLGKEGAQMSKSGVRGIVILLVISITLVALSAIACAKPATLVVWTWRAAGDQSIGYDNQFERFQKKYPDIKINLVRVPWNDYWTKLIPSIMAGTGPDVFLGFGANTTYFVRDAGIWEPIPSTVFTTGWIEKNFISTVKMWKRNDRYYSLPDEAAALGLFYNPDHFKEVGLDPDRPPRTWDELREYAIKLTKRDAKGKITRSGLALMLNDNDFQVTWYTLLMQMGGSVIDSKTGKCVLNSSAGEKSLQYFIDLWKDGVDSVETTNSWQAFRDGNASMIITEPAYQSVWYIQKPDIKLRIAHVPTLKPGDEPIYCDIGRWGWVVSTRSKYKAEAWKLFKHVNSLDERVLRRIDPAYLLTYPPAMPAEATDPRVIEFLKGKPAEVKTWYEIGKHGRFIGDVKNYTYWIRVVQPVISKTWFKNADIKSTLQELEQACNDFLTKPL